MSDPTFDTLTQRLDGLEREMRCWRIVGGAVAVVMSIVLFLAATHTKVPEEIRAKRFVVVGDDGRPRGEFGAMRDLKDHWGLLIHKKDGWGRMSLILSEWGRPSFAMADDERKWRFLVSLGAEGAPYLTMSGKPMVKSEEISLGLLGGAPSLVFKDSHWRTRVVLGKADMVITSRGVEDRPLTSLVLLDEVGRVIWKAP